MHRDDFDAALHPGFRKATESSYSRLDAAQSSEDGARAGESQGLRIRRPCPLCGRAGDTQPAMRKAGLELVRCTSCGMAYSRTMVEEAADRTFYGATGFQAAYLGLKKVPAYAALEQLKCRYIMEALGRWHAPGRLLDIGCGAGRLLEAALSLGWTATGIEPNPLFVAHCRERGLDVLEGWFPAAAPGRYDAVSLLDVLEHAADPVRLLEDVRAVLAAGGMVVVQVPNFDSLAVQADGMASPVVCHGHWNYFDAASLRRCAGLAGFRVAGIETVISEVDRLLRHPRDAIAAALARVRPGLSLPESVGPGWLHEHLMGYKLLAYLEAVPVAPGAT